jgi:MSHA biogenesis protein MshM
MRTPVGAIGNGSLVYQAHFGLNHAPFCETAHPSAYVALPSRDAALRRLSYAFDAGQAAALLCGPPGSGKTLLVKRLANQRGVPAVHISFPIGSPWDVIGQIAEEIGTLNAVSRSWEVEPPAEHPRRGHPTGSHQEVRPPGIVQGHFGTRSSNWSQEMLRQLRRHLAALAARGERPLVVVDDAQAITDPGVFEALRLLLNFASEGPPDVALLLVASGDFRFDLPGGLADRLAARCLIAPFTESESGAYIRGRLAAAGAKSPLFTAQALKALHRDGEGLARRLNRLADMSLLIAFARDLSMVDEETVSLAGREHTPVPILA